MATFKETFAAERKKKGKGKTFEYEGKTYTTDYAGENGPKPRPANLNPKSGASRATDNKVKPAEKPFTLGRFGGQKEMAGAANAAKPAAVPTTSATPARPISPTRDPSATGRYSEYEKARLGNYTEAEYDAMSRPQREAKGLPVSYIDYVRSGGASAVKKAAGGVVKKMGGGAMGYAAGGKMKMVEKGGKKVPSFAADGVGKMAKGGMSKEGTAKDMREDKAKAKKAGMTMKQWEASSKDVAHDKPSKMKTGGGVMRGAGAATRGKKFSGSY